MGPTMCVLVCVCWWGNKFWIYSCLPTLLCFQVCTKCGSIGIDIDIGTRELAKWKTKYEGHWH